MRTRARRTPFASALIAALLTAGASADPCQSDATCNDGIDCNGIETCGSDGQCRPGFGLCGPATSFVGTRVTASSVYGAAYAPSNLIDGLDQSGSSWCSARNDPAPSVAITWAIGVEVHEIHALTSWSPGYDFLTGRFRLLDASGATLFDSGTVTFTNGEIALPVVPAASGVRRLELTGETWRSSDPCLSEIEVVGALPCATDADCAFASPCIAVGVCPASGSCAATAPRCRNLALSFASLSASSSDPPYLPAKLADGSSATGDSWCAAPGDAAPSIAIALPNEHPVSLIRVTNPWPSYEFRTGLFTIEDALGAVVFDSGPVTFDRGAIEIVLEPVVGATHEVRLDALTTIAEPCVGELELLGEYCEISVTPDDPMTITFRPSTPTPEFELRYGKITDLHADAGFDRAVCLGRYTAESVSETLPDPEPGEGTYLLARGLNVCLAEGFGLSGATPDPRADLAASPTCAP